MIKIKEETKEEVIVCNSCKCEVIIPTQKNYQHENWAYVKIKLAGQDDSDVNAMHFCPTCWYYEED
jgi:hypothetical protein